jgi:hypothetical protein
MVRVLSCPRVASDDPGREPHLLEQPTLPGRTVPAPRDRRAKALRPANACQRESERTAEVSPLTARGSASNVRRVGIPNGGR